MSKYTTEVRYICENYAELEESGGYSDVDEILSNSWDKVFDFAFPIFDENYRSVLCQKILKHYYTREISFETVGLWKLKLNMMMNEIMPYYNLLYNSAALTYNPLVDADYTKTHEGEDAGSGTETGTHTGTVADSGVRNTDYEQDQTNWNVYSDTPQGALTNVENETYLTNARKVTNHTEGSNDETNSNTRTYNEGTGLNRRFSNTDEYVDHIIGKFPGKSYPQLIREYRENFLNIDVDIINELSDLFIKIW